MVRSRKLFRTIGIAAILAACLLSIPIPAFAISLPSSVPVVEDIYCYRHVLQPNDFLVIVYENTPYTTTPTDYDYSEAFVWRFFGTDGTTEVAQALGYDYHDEGFGYNVISFYFDNITAPAWEQNYIIRLSGTPSAFNEPPQYNYQIVSGDYSGLTNTADVKIEIANRILLLAQDLDTKWGLTATYSLLLEMETGTALSIYGEAFFRGAIYGIQGMAPAAFRLVVGAVEHADRAWTTTYASNVESQHTGTYLEPALAAGERFFDVDYNLFGIIGTLILCVLLIGSNWYIQNGGNVWKGSVEGVSPLVISARLGMFGMAEVALLAAICWLFISAKLWKVI